MKDLKYKGYVGSVEADFDHNILFGKLLFIKDLVNYEADSPDALKAAFEEAVDDYLADCKEQGVAPDMPFKGQFNVRVSADLHRQMAFRARAQSKSLNEYVSGVLCCHEEVGENGQIKPESVQHFVVIANTHARQPVAHAVSNASSWALSGQPIVPSHSKSGETKSRWADPQLSHAEY